MIARMAFRNMFRQKRRSILTALSMGGGVALFAMALGMSDGSYDYIIDTLTRTHEIWSEVVYGEDEAGGVSLVDLNTTNPERMDTPCTRIRECRSDSQR